MSIQFNSAEKVAKDTRNTINKAGVAMHSIHDKTLQLSKRQSALADIVATDFAIREKFIKGETSDIIGVKTLAEADANLKKSTHDLAVVREALAEYKAKEQVWVDKAIAICPGKYDLETLKAWFEDHKFTVSDDEDVREYIEAIGTAKLASARKACKSGYLTTDKSNKAMAKVFVGLLWDAMVQANAINPYKYSAEAKAEVSDNK